MILEQKKIAIGRGVFKSSRRLQIKSTHGFQRSWHQNKVFSLDFSMNFKKFPRMHGFSDCISGCILPLFTHVYGYVSDLSIDSNHCLILWSLLGTWGAEMILELLGFWESNQVEIPSLRNHCFTSKQKRSTVARWPPWNVWGPVST